MEKEAEYERGLGDGYKKGHTAGWEDGWAAAADHCKGLLPASSPSIAGPRVIGLRR